MQGKTLNHQRRKYEEIVLLGDVLLKKSGTPKIVVLWK
jgi:hypothetical protein